MDAKTEALGRIESGARQLTIAQFKAAFAALGYTFDASAACKSVARYMTGPKAGETYPADAWYPVQADNGLSAWNVDARRDANFQAMQILRNEIFAVSRGHIIEV